MSKHIQIACAWAGLAFFILYIIAFVGIARFVPPPAPSWSAEQIDALFTDHAIAIRVGMVLGLIATALLIPFFAVISVQIARIERGLVLALIQFGGAVLLIVFFQLCSMLWIAATFRPELDPATTRMLNDLSWLIFVMVFPGYVFQLTCIAIASFTDHSSSPIWPRWVGYLNLWVALGGTGGGIAAFFKAGPFAWNGVIGFYVPIVAFVAWIGVMTYYTHTGITRQFAARSATEHDSKVYDTIHAT
jgi:hypothetical protein